jgi:predicted transposase YdaD
LAKVVDIGSKRLIGMSPTPWVRWLTGDEEAVAQEMLGNELQFVSRANDVLIKVRSAQHGDYLVAVEVQLRVDARMPLRMRSYAALIEERYALPVYPVVINVLRTEQRPATAYRSSFMALTAVQEYRVVNLWELDAEQVLAAKMPALLPFVPIMVGGNRVDIVQRAVYALRSDAELADFETFLAFIARFVFDSETILSIMRWDMATLRENPWYAEILQEGIEAGREEGREAGREEGREEGREAATVTLVELLLVHRFGAADPALLGRIRRLSPEQLVSLTDAIYMSPSLQGVADQLDAILG